MDTQTGGGDLLAQAESYSLRAALAPAQFEPRNLACVGSRRHETHGVPAREARLFAIATGHAAAGWGRALLSRLVRREVSPWRS